MTNDVNFPAPRNDEQGRCADCGADGSQPGEAGAHKVGCEWVADTVAALPAPDEPDE